MKNLLAIIAMCSILFVGFGCAPAEPEGDTTGTTGSGEGAEATEMQDPETDNGMGDDATEDDGMGAEDDGTDDMGDDDTAADDSADDDAGATTDDATEGE